MRLPKKLIDAYKINTEDTLKPEDWRGAGAELYVGGKLIATRHDGEWFLRSEAYAPEWTYACLICKWALETSHKWRPGEKTLEVSLNTQIMEEDIEIVLCHIREWQDVI